MCNLREVCNILSEFVSAVFTPLCQVLPMKIGAIKPCWYERFFFYKVLSCVHQYSISQTNSLHVRTKVLNSQFLSKVNVYDVTHPVCHLPAQSQSCLKYCEIVG